MMGKEQRLYLILPATFSKQVSQLVNQYFDQPFQTHMHIFMFISSSYLVSIHFLKLNYSLTAFEMTPKFDFTH